MVTIQQADFNIAEQYAHLRKIGGCGAIVTFTGLVREFLKTSGSQTLTLEYYPGMAEKTVEQYISKAKSRWNVLHVEVIHRIGALTPGDQIVFVGVCSKHRHDAFNTAQYVMDKLKSEAPFWKKENDQWVVAKKSDDNASQSWD